MMMITPQARRRIAGAIGTLPDARSQERWRSWAGRVPPNEIQADIPYEIAVIALEALTTVERKIEQRLEEKDLDEDIEADLLNDLGYIQSIETALRNEGIGR